MKTQNPTTETRHGGAQPKPQSLTTKGTKGHQGKVESPLAANEREKTRIHRTAALRFPLLVVNFARLAQAIGGGFWRQIALGRAEHFKADHEFCHCR
jgi:hypothetical protein